MLMVKIMTIAHILLLFHYLLGQYTFIDVSHIVLYNFIAIFPSFKFNNSTTFANLELYNFSSITLM